MSEVMEKGKVKWWDATKGYGFITREKGGKEVFCHYTGILDKNEDGRRDLADGESVEFLVEQSEKGPKAAKVRRL